MFTYSNRNESKARKSSVARRGLVVAAALSALILSAPAFAGQILYAQTSGTLSTGGNWTFIQSLTLTLPAASAGAHVALVTLNVPNPYAMGTNFPGGEFGIAVNNAILLPIAAFTYNTLNPVSSGRVPSTLVVEVPLTANTQTIAAAWSGIRGSTVVMDTPSTLSAVIE